MSIQTTWFALTGIVCAALTVGCSGANPQEFSEETGTQSSALSAAPPVGGSWSAFTNGGPAGLGTCLQLTNGDVMCHQSSTNTWRRLRPDVFGSYKNGAWDLDPIPPMPNRPDGQTYGPLYFASAVLPDGRAVVIGGEYNNGVNTEQNTGFIYNPVTNSWSGPLQEPTGSVGDAMGLVFQDGTFGIFNIFSSDVEILNPTTGVFTSRNPSGKLDGNSEENPVPLYDGTIMVVDSNIVSSFERYNPTTNTWGNSGTTPVNLPDTGPGSNFSIEVGPCSLRPDNQVMCFSGNPSGKNALYNPSTNTWTHTASMDFPLAPDGVSHYSMADGPAASLPNGNILVLASPVMVGSTYNRPSHFYEVSLSGNTLAAVADTPNSVNVESYNGRMLLLPTGEVLYTGSDTMIYTASGGPLDAWRPAITVAPSTITGGGSFSVSGRLFNGFSEGASYGDDAQSATNYPLVRITNTASGHVVYAKTSGHSRMGLEPVGSTTVVSTNFQVPANIESGASTLQVVANGIASLPQAITVGGALTALSRTGWVASASNTTGGDVPANALDGNTATRYSDGIPQSNATTHTFTVDMLSAKSFSQITLDSTTDYARNYQVFVSNDGATWGTAIASGTATAARTTITFSAVSARYIQVRQTTAAGVGSWWSIYEFNVYGSGSTGGGSALSRTGWVLTGSATSGADVVGRAIDASATTRWSTGLAQSVASTQTLTIDMLSAQAFDKITLDSAADYARNYQVYVSTNGTTWGSAIATGNGVTGTTTISFAQQNARYIQIRQTASAGTAAWWSVYELNVYSPAGPVAPLSRSGWTATGSSTAEAPTNALDGVTTTRWSTGAAQVNGQYYQVDMQTAKTFRQITLDSATAAGDYPRGYQFFVSNDGSTWGSAIASGTPTTQLVTINFTTQTARFIKVVQTGTVTPNWWSLYEFSVYN